MLFSTASTNNQRADDSISLPWQVLTVAEPSTGFPLDPTLAVAVLWVLDVFARVEQSLSIKAVIDVPGMWDIASSDDPHEAIIFPNPHLASICGAGSSDRFIRRLLSQQALDLLV